MANLINYYQGKPFDEMAWSNQIRVKRIASALCAFMGLKEMKEEPVELIKSVFDRWQFARLLEGSPLQGHPSMIKCPGIDISTGSLGQGLACAAGMALAGKMDKKDYKVFCVVGDGEAQEGEIWEAANTANKYKLDNLIVFVDVNRLQLDGTCEEVMPNGDLGAKFKAFGWDVYYYDGNSMEETVEVLDKCYAPEAQNGNPKALIGATVKGKGVSFMENQVGWHGVAPNDEQYAQAMEELKAQLI